MFHQRQNQHLGRIRELCRTALAPGRNVVTITAALGEARRVLDAVWARDRTEGMPTPQFRELSKNLGEWALAEAMAQAVECSGAEIAAAQGGRPLADAQRIFVDLVDGWAQAVAAAAESEWDPVSRMAAAPSPGPIAAASSTAAVRGRGPPGLRPNTFRLVIRALSSPPADIEAVLGALRKTLEAFYKDIPAPVQAQVLEASLSEVEGLAKAAREGRSGDPRVRAASHTKILVTLVSTTVHMESLFASCEGERMRVVGMSRAFAFAEIDAKLAWMAARVARVAAEDASAPETPHAAAPANMVTTTAGDIKPDNKGSGPTRGEGEPGSVAGNEGDRPIAGAMHTEDGRTAATAAAAAGSHNPQAQMGFRTPGAAHKQLAGRGAVATPSKPAGAGRTVEAPTSAGQATARGQPAQPLSVAQIEAEMVACTDAMAQAALKDLAAVAEELRVANRKEAEAAEAAADAMAAVLILEEEAKKDFDKARAAAAAVGREAQPRRLSPKRPGRKARAARKTAGTGTGTGIRMSTSTLAVAAVAAAGHYPDQASAPALAATLGSAPASAEARSLGVAAAMDFLTADPEKYSPAASEAAREVPPPPASAGQVSGADGAVLVPPAARDGKSGVHQYHVGSPESHGEDQERDVCCTKSGGSDAVDIRPLVQGMEGMGVLDTREAAPAVVGGWQDDSGGEIVSDERDQMVLVEEAVAQQDVHTLREIIEQAVERGDEGPLQALVERACGRPGLGPLRKDTRKELKRMQAAKPTQDRGAGGQGRRRRHRRIAWRRGFFQRRWRGGDGGGARPASVPVVRPCGWWSWWGAYVALPPSPARPLAPKGHSCGSAVGLGGTLSFIPRQTCHE